MPQPKHKYTVMIDGKMYRVVSLALVNNGETAGVSFDLRNVLNEKDQISGTVPLFKIVRSGLDNDHLIQFLF